MAAFEQIEDCERFCGRNDEDALITALRVDHSKPARFNHVSA